MCKYIAKINMKFGEMSVSLGDDYAKAIDKYKEIKQEYEAIPCEICFYNSVKDDVQFKKINKEESFDVLYERLINVLADISRYQINMSRKESKYTEVRNSLYHNLEETNLSGLTTEEQVKMLFDMKITLNQRRLIEDENQRCYAFFKNFKNICNEIMKYNTEKEKRLTHGQGRFGNEYYNEDLSNKKKRTKELLLTLNN